MTELLIVKTPNGYYRFREDEYFLCELNKASVFSLSEATKAKDLCAMLHRNGVVEASLMKLTIIEEPYLEE